MSPNKLTFLVDNIDPITGPKPNLLGFTDEKYTLKSIFTNCKIEYRSSWSAPDIDKWFYPIMLMDGITLNNFLLQKQKDIFIKNHISERVQLGLKNKKGKILIVLYEPVSQLTSHILSENFGDNLNFVFVTLHNSDKSNFLTWVPCTFIGCGKDGRGLKKEKEESNTINIDKLDNRYFSCFTYFYNDNPYTTIAIRLLEQNNLLDKGFVSMYNKGIDFEKLISLSKLHYKYNILIYDFKNSDKVFDLLPVEQCLKQSLFNFVVESFEDGAEYVSEKTHRNFLYKKAFLSWGSPNQLKLIKSQGYKTFSPIINESYDAVENHKKRFTMVIDELKRLVNKDYNELKNDFITINHILDHNYSNFLKRNDNIGNKLIGTFNE